MKTQSIQLKLLDFTSNPYEVCQDVLGRVDDLLDDLGEDKYAHLHGSKVSGRTIVVSASDTAIELMKPLIANKRIRLQNAQ
jgi:hypothetical protein